MSKHLFQPCLISCLFPLAHTFWSNVYWHLRVRTCRHTVSCHHNQFGNSGPREVKGWAPLRFTSSSVATVGGKVTLIWCLVELTLVVTSHSRTFASRCPSPRSISTVNFDRTSSQLHCCRRLSPFSSSLVGRGLQGNNLPLFCLYDEIAYCCIHTLTSFGRHGDWQPWRTELLHLFNVVFLEGC